MNFRARWKFFAEESSIHGIRYIADENSHKGIRTLWTFAFVLSIMGLTFYVHGVYEKWRLSPDIGIAANLKPIREIAFPAITICAPMNIKDKYANFYEAFHIRSHTKQNKSTIDNPDMISAIIQSCDPNLSSVFMDLLEHSASRGVIDELLKGSFSKNETLYRCYLNNDFRHDCNEMFNRVITDDGICYSYNMQGYHTIFNEDTLDEDFDMFIRKGTRNIVVDDSKYFDDADEKIEWTLQNGYTSDDETAYPLRIIMENSVEFILQHPKNETNNYCPTLRNSYKIIFHMPNEIPTKFHDYIYSSMGTQFLIVMTAKHYMTDVSLKTYKPNVRRCFFENERKLRFFKSYTEAQCDLECLTNFTLKRCGCVKFSMPRTSDMPVCNLKEAVCYNHAIQHWPHLDENSANLSVPCECYPPCNNIKYGTKLIDHVDIESMLNLDTFDTIKTTNNISAIFTSIKITFKDFLINEQILFVGYKLENFIAECGGLLGLFMGCSVLSIVELFYLCIKGIAKPKEQSKQKEVKVMNYNRFLYDQSMIASNFENRIKILQKQSRIKSFYRNRELKQN